jgi:hypothetical protein
MQLAPYASIKLAKTSSLRDLPSSQACFLFSHRSGINVFFRTKRTLSLSDLLLTSSFATTLH